MNALALCVAMLVTPISGSSGDMVTSVVHPGIVGASYLFLRSFDCELTVDDLRKRFEHEVSTENTKGVNQRVLHSVLDSYGLNVALIDDETVSLNLFPIPALFSMKTGTVTRLVFAESRDSEGIWCVDFYAGTAHRFHIANDDWPMLKASMLISATYTDPLWIIFPLLIVIFALGTVATKRYAWRRR